jgi:catechol 2,3-dioxygenase-like lactoylglutathione lyase family enzyme
MEAKMKIGSIVVRCYEFDRMLAFWQEALGYEPREPEENGWVVLRDPEGRGPNVSLDRVAKPLVPLGKTSRAHLEHVANRMVPCEDAEHGHLLEGTQDQGGRCGRAGDP